MSALRIDLKGDRRLFGMIAGLTGPHIRLANAVALQNTGRRAARDLKDHLNASWDIEARGLLRQYNPNRIGVMYTGVDKRTPIFSQEVEVGYPSRSVSGNILPDVSLHQFALHKKPKPSSKKIAIPTSRLKRRNSGKKVVPKRLKPRQLLNKSNHKIVNIGKKSFIARKPSSRSKKRFVEPMYLLADRAKIDKVIHLDRVVKNRFSRTYKVELTKRLRTAIRRSTGSQFR